MTLQGMMGMPMQQPVGVAGGVAAGGAMAANTSQQPKQVPQPKSKKVLLQCYTRPVLHSYSVILVHCVAYTYNVVQSSSHVVLAGVFHMSAVFAYAA